MKYIIHSAESRGRYDYGWLKTNHTFSFAGYKNPERMHFGAIRVLNDDTVAPNEGFGTHPHNNMEMISIVLSGSLKHMDSMGSASIIKAGDVQVMTAGTGIMHSEMNASNNEPVEFLQIWIYPSEKDLAPSYDQQSFDFTNSKNDFPDFRP